MAASHKTVLDAGDRAPWLVMVHGMSQDHRVFSAQTQAFKERHRILLIDLPGHGLSSHLPGPFGRMEMADQVAGALDHAGVGVCDYWGTHTGAILGLLLAAEKPERFHSLVLEGAVLPGHVMPSQDGELDHIREVARNQGMDEARRMWFYEGPWFAVIRGRPDECRAAAHWQMVVDFSGAPWLDNGVGSAASVDDQLASLQCPVLLYNGEHDVPDFIAAADHLERLLPNARQATIPDGGGFPCWEFPEPVNTLVADFLAAQTP